MTDQPDKRGRGGRRPGAGRKPIGEQLTLPVTVTLLPDQIAYLETVGEGNMSLGIRRLIEWHKSAQHTNADRMGDR